RAVPEPLQRQRQLFRDLTSVRRPRPLERRATCPSSSRSPETSAAAPPATCRRCCYAESDASLQSEGQDQTAYLCNLRSPPSQLNCVYPYSLPRSFLPGVAGI